MKRKLTLLLALAMTLALTGCGDSSDKPNTTASTTNTGTAGTNATYESLKSVELVGADSTGKGAAGQIFGELIAAKVDEITGGKLTIDYHPNGDLGGDADLLRQMQSNDIQLVVCQTAPVVSFVPDMAVFDLPMVFSKYDGDTIDKVLNDADSAFHAQISESFENASFHLLGFLQNATYRLATTNKEVRDIASFKGLQIRTMENSNHMAFWTAINAEPTPMAWAEVYFALQSGAIDAQENAADTCVGANLNEVQKYLACTNHILYTNQVAMNKDAYEALDPLYQDALNQAVEEALAQMRPTLAEIDTTNKQILQDKGMTLIEYDDAFYDEILAMDSVKALYSQIDTEINGLGTTLQQALENG